MRSSNTLSNSALRAAVIAALLLAAGTAPAQTGGGLIFNCTDASGKRLTRDRYIAECSDREQRVLNSDGSLREIRQPTRTDPEVEAVDRRKREIAEEEKQHKEEVKRDSNLLHRYPDEAAHRKARQAALEDVRAALRVSEKRLAALAKERKPLDDETEFYVGKQLPLKLKQAIDANDASVDAQKALVQNQQLEIVRIDRRFDAELERLRAMWNGARPGSLGAIAAASAPSRK